MKPCSRRPRELHAERIFMLMSTARNPNCGPILLVSGNLFRCSPLAHSVGEIFSSGGSWKKRVIFRPLISFYPFVYLTAHRHVVGPSLRRGFATRESGHWVVRPFIKVIVRRCSV